VSTWVCVLDSVAPSVESFRDFFVGLVVTSCVTLPAGVEDDGLLTVGVGVGEESNGVS